MKTKYLIFLTFLVFTFSFVSATNEFAYNYLDNGGSGNTTYANNITNNFYNSYINQTINITNNITNNINITLTNNITNNITNNFITINNFTFANLSWYNETQMENSLGNLTIKESWLSSFINSIVNLKFIQNILNSTGIYTYSYNQTIPANSYTDNRITAVNTTGQQALTINTTKNIQELMNATISMIANLTNWTSITFNAYNTTWTELSIIKTHNSTATIGQLYNYTASLIANLSISQTPVIMNNLTISQVANLSIGQLNWTYSWIANNSINQITNTTTQQYINMINSTYNIGLLYNVTASMIANLSISQTPVIMNNLTISQVANLSIGQLNWTYSWIANTTANQYSAMNNVTRTIGQLYNATASMIANISISQNLAINNLTASQIANLSIGQLNWTYSLIANNSLGQWNYTIGQIINNTIAWNFSATSVYLNNPSLNVGIGTTSPTRALDIVGAGGWSSSGGIRINGSNPGIEIADTPGGQRWLIANGVMLGNDGKLGLAYDFNAGVHRLVIQNGTGNVGIGTSSPTTALSIFRGAGIDTSIFLWQQGTASGYVGNKASDTNFYLTNSYYGETIGTATKSLALTKDGNVGIGTATPIGKLNVRTGTDQDLSFLPGTTYGGSDGIALISTNDANSVYKQLVLAGSNIILNAAGGTGNVGIGTATPINKLVVNQNGTTSPFAGGLAGITIENPDITQNSLMGITFRNSDSAGTMRHLSAIVSGKQDAWTNANSSTWDSFLSFWTRLNGGDEVEAMRIDATGNVGIGTTTPDTQLVISGKLANVSGIATGTNPYSVYVQGRYAYVANYGGNNMQIIDISNPSSPVNISGIATGSSPYTVYIQGRYAYVVNSNGKNIQIIDISTPSSLVNVSGIATGNNPRAVYVQGRYAYVTNYGGKNMQIIDISNPSSLVNVSGIATGTNPLSVYVQGRYAYVSNSGGKNMQIIDISNPSSPVNVSGIATGSNPYSVYVQGRYAYVANYIGNNMQIIDISNPSSPVNVSGIATGNGPYSVYVQGRYAYVANSGGKNMQIIDISNPSSLVNVSGIATGNTPLSVYVQGRYAYVANYNGNNTQIIDLGGAYIQQFEAGGIESSTLSVMGNTYIGNNLDVKSGLSVGGFANFMNGLSVFSGDGGNSTFVVNPNGNVGIGTATPTSKLQVNGSWNLSGTKGTFYSNTSGTIFMIPFQNLTVTGQPLCSVSNITGEIQRGTTTSCAVSSERYKSEITNFSLSANSKLASTIDGTPTNSALDLINQLRVTTYREINDKSGKYFIGLIGEEVAKILPEIMEEDNNYRDRDLLSLNIKATQELSEKIKLLQEENLLLKQDNILLRENGIKLQDCIANSKDFTEMQGCVK